jgi:ATP-dependent helicase/nuclease subunit A
MSSSSLVAEMQKPFPSRFIRAGAGAGKTSTLIKTFFEFVEYFKTQNTKLPKIIITTFTRKATQEVKERLLLHAMSMGRQDLFQYINKKSLVHISTIHGVLSLMLSKNHDLLGLSSDIKVCDNKFLYKMYYREMKSIFKGHAEYFDLLEQYNFKDLVTLATKFHENASEHDIKYVEKEVLLELRKNKIEKALSDFNEILQVKPQVEGHKNWGPYFDFIETFAQAFKAGDFLKAFEIYDNKSSKPRFSQDKPLFDASVHDLIADYFSSDSDFISSLDSDEFIESVDAVNSLFDRLAREFHNRISLTKKQSGQISINDLETLSLKLITEFPEEVKNFANQYDYFMVDEYQDTSPLQVKILNALIHTKSQFTVGDPQQSIYLFRGARSEVFLEKEAHSQEKGHELIRLLTNYRSDHKLMHSLNDITGSFSKQFLPMLPKELSRDENDIQTYFVKTEDEYTGLVNHIAFLHQKGVAFGDMCILFNKNNDIFDFAKYALKHNVPVQSLIAAGFDRKREIIDLVSFLKFLVNPYDNLNLHILMRSPWFSITDEEIYALRQSNKSFWQQLKQSKHLDSKTLSQYLQCYQQKGVLAALENFLLDSGFLLNSYLLDPTGKREANIYKFISNLKENIRSEQFILNDFLSSQFGSFQEDLSSNLNESVALFSGNRVSIMTIHGSKGLQFKHVLLAGVCARPKQTNIMQFMIDADTHQYSIPVLNREMKLSWSSWGKQQKRILNEKEYLEYERLFYVAITRAEKSISFIAEMAKKPASNSWHTKLNWPAPGLHPTSTYTQESLEYGPEVNSIPNNGFQAITVKPKLDLAPTAASLSAGTISVTELISTPESPNPNAPIKIEPVMTEKIIDHLNKAQKGTDLHRLFESTKYLSRDQVLDKATTDEKAALKWLLNLKEIPFQSILDHGYAEWGFGLKTQLGTIQGQIDLWGRIGNQVYILDYKTGSSLYSEKAVSQLSRYSECLKKMNFIKPNDSIQLVVLYPFEEKIVIERRDFAQINAI